MKELEFDIVVVGAGGAGMAAALFAALRKQRVLLLESTAHVGGSTAYSAGTAWIPNTRHAGVGGANDSVANAERFLDHAVGDRTRRSLRRAFLEHGPEAIAELERSTEVQFRARAFHPDYESQLEGALTSGRAIEPCPFDGRKLGAAFGLLRPPLPEFTVLGGMMVDRDDINHLLGAGRSWTSFQHTLRLLARHGVDRLRHDRGTRLTMGNALCGRLLHALRQRNVPIWTQARVTRIERGENAVDGLIVEHNNDELRIRVRQAVIMATGGFNRHEQLRATMLPQPAREHCPGAPGHTGALHDLAREFGARYTAGNRDHVFWAPVSTARRDDGSKAVYPHFFLDRGKPGMVAVNQHGQRFVNEATSYHRFVQAMVHADRQEATIPAFLITDSVGLQRYGLGLVRPGGRGLRRLLRDGYVVRGESVAELANRLGIPAAALEVTLATMNAYAESGVDPDFQRGSTVYQRANGDASHAPNPCLGPIRQAPYYAVRLFPGDIGAATGFDTDDDAQVVGDDGPIAGLYACGNDMSSIMGDAYPAPGITIGPGLVFAYIAVRHALQSAQHPSRIEEKV
jgi:succinate dehydrogenase/fumarate reductase flavoprotein subunit